MQTKRNCHLSAAAAEGDTRTDDDASGASEGQHCADAAMRDNYKTVLDCNKLGNTLFCALIQQ